MPTRPTSSCEYWDYSGASHSHFSYLASHFLAQSPGRYFAHHTRLRGSHSVSLTGRNCQSTGVQPASGVVLSMSDPMEHAVLLAHCGGPALSQHHSAPLCRLGGQLNWQGGDSGGVAPCSHDICTLRTCCSTLRQFPPFVLLYLQTYEKSRTVSDHSNRTPRLVSDELTPGLCGRVVERPASAISALVPYRQCSLCTTVLFSTLLHAALWLLQGFSHVGAVADVLSN